MKINKDGTIEKSEEILVSGVSLVFYDVWLLKRKLEDAQIVALLKNNGFREVNVDLGYSRKIFSNQSHDSYKHLFIRHGSSIDFPMLNISNGVGGNRSIVPKVTFYLNIYDRNIVVFQPVIVFDKNSVTQFRNRTAIDFDLDTNNLLEIIHYFKTVGRDGYNMMKQERDKIVQKFESSIGINGIFDDSVNYEEDNESVGIQIWDISNLNPAPGAMIYGSELEERFELELSALINYQNEHFANNNMWKQQSANSVWKTTGRHTDVLNDHRILQSDRVCVEISQVNYPTIRPISSTRLCEYGYDSTSLYLWGYIQIIKKVYSICQNKSSKLRDRTTELLDDSGQQKLTEESSRITKEMTELYKELEIHNRIKNSCIEKRHRDFITQGMEATGLDSIHKDMEDIFQQIKEGVNVSISARTSKSNSEMAEILAAIRTMSKTQSDDSEKLAMITIIFTVPGICTLSEFFTSLNASWVTAKEKLISLLICAACYAVFIFAYTQYRRRK